METTSILTQMRHELVDNSILEQAKSYAIAYIDEVRNRTVFPEAKALEDLHHFDEPLPEVSLSAEDVLSQLNRFGSPATVAQTGGRYFGFVNGGVTPAALAARWLADAWDQNAALYLISPVVAKLEQVCQRWLSELFALPPATVAGFVTGTSIATLCGLAAARHTILKRLDWDVNEDGLSGAPAFRVVLSEQAHGTVFRALSLLGIGKRQLDLVPADNEGRLNSSELPTLDSSTLLVLQAGNVNTGAFDAFDCICHQAEEAGAWVHVDASTLSSFAFGRRPCARRIVSIIESSRR